MFLVKKSGFRATWSDCSKTSPKSEKIQGPWL